MLTPEQRREILVQSLERHLSAAELAWEGVIYHQNPKGNLSGLERAFHTIKSDSAAAGLRAVAELAEAFERAFEAALADPEFEPERDLVDAGLKELRRTEKRLRAGQAAEIGRDVLARARRLGNEAQKRLRGDRVRPA